MKNVVCKYLQDVRLTNYSFSNYNFCDPLKKMRYFCLFIFLNRFTYCAEFPIGLSQFNGQVAEQLIHDLYTFNYPNKTFLTTPKARRLSSHPWKYQFYASKYGSWVLDFRFPWISPVLKILPRVHIQIQWRDITEFALTLTNM